jgi:hypothetical protein
MSKEYKLSAETADALAMLAIARTDAPAASLADKPVVIVAPGVTPRPL